MSHKAPGYVPSIEEWELLLSRVDDLEVQDEAQWVTLRAERANAEHLVTLVERLERQVRELQGHLHVRLESGSEFIGYPEELPA